MICPLFTYLFTYLLTYLLTYSVFLEKLAGNLLVKNFPKFY